MRISAKIESSTDKSLEEKFIELDKKLNVPDAGNDNVIMSVAPKTMDLSKMSKAVLLDKCRELNIKRCKSKTKSTLVQLIESKENQVKDDESTPTDNVVITAPVAPSYNYEKDEEYLKTFLDGIRKKDGYKRVLISPLRYAGGKSKAIGLILDQMPKLKNKRIISPFFGGGSLELCLSQKLGIEVVGYDIFGMLTNFWDVLINNKQAFITELKKFEINATEFTKNRHILLSHWTK